MSTQEYTVQGMTCDHCARAVHEEVAGVTNVEDVTVDLAGGRLTVVGDDVDAAAVSAAVAAAGYTVA